MRSISRPMRAEIAPLTSSAMRRRITVGALAALTAVVLSAAVMAPDDTPVADAVMRGDSAQVRTLIQQGMDVNAAQADGMTALHWAASRGDAATARMLLFAGARPAAVTRNGNYTPLHLAARNGRGEAIKVLLENGADPRAVTTSGGATALHFAAGEGDSLSVATLVAAKVDVDAREGAWDQTPLMWAAAYNRVPAIRVLLAGGADIDAVSKVEDMAEVEKAERAQLVARTRRVSAIREAERVPLTAAQLDSIKADSVRAEAIRVSNLTDEERAAEAVKAEEAAKKAEEARKKAEAAKRETEKKAREAAKNPKAALAAAPTARRGGGGGGGGGYGELVGNKGGLTPLLFAVRDGNLQAVEALLAAGAQINHVSGDHTSPLLMAAINGRFDMAMMLLEKGADPKLASDAGATPLYSVINVQWAAKSLYPQPTAQQQQQTTHLELMDALIKAGADVNARLTKHLWYMSYNFDLLGVNTTGATPFWRAAYGLDVPAMRLLQSHGADISLPTLKPAGRSFNADASPDAGEVKEDPSGLPPIETGGPGVFPLHAASGVGYGEGFAANSHQHAPDAWLPSVKYLIEELGVDPNARDFNGYNALHHAAARGDTVLGQYLIDKGVDITALSRKGQTVADMANGPVQRVPPFLEALDFFVRKGSKNSNKCLSC